MEKQLQDGLLLLERYETYFLSQPDKCIFHEGPFEDIDSVIFGFISIGHPFYEMSG